MKLKNNVKTDLLEDMKFPPLPSFTVSPLCHILKKKDRLLP